MLVVLSLPGDGDFPRSIDAGSHAGGGGSLRFTDAALASGKGRLSQLFLRRLLDDGERRPTELLDTFLKPKVLWVMLNRSKCFKRVVFLARSSWVEEEELSEDEALPRR
ncbi:Uncharacterized protein Rs2_32777 [Raphanus sativus]|nr:Uncharacterized protein Rs2_32777 [Raphanus sativus]